MYSDRKETKNIGRFSFVLFNRKKEFEQETIQNKKVYESVYLYSGGVLYYLNINILSEYKYIKPHLNINV